MAVEYEIVIGLEVHVELATRSKIFCACSTAFGAEPNTQTCPVCLGLPGALPVLNHEALNLGLRAALALQCEPAAQTKFDRKNYFYPDLPKAYQISQFDLPLALRGHLDVFPAAGGVRTIGITRVHLEEDAGKLLHESAGGQISTAESSLVDYNRGGVPLIEIVSEPDLRTAEEAYLYLVALKEILQFAEISDCNMEEGSLRCDANISVRPVGQQALGTKAELKNMNSFKHVRAGIEYEAKRQIRLLREGGRVVQETRAWDAQAGVTTSLRSKEEAHDYRYFPEPDLPLINITAERLAEIRAALPELPRARRARFQAEYGLSEYDAGVLTASPELSAFFESAAQGTSPKAVCNWLTVELLGKLNAEGKDISASPVSPAQLNALVRLIEAGEISGKIGKQVFAEMAVSGEDAPVVVKRLGLSQISDAGSLQKIVDQVLAAHPGPVAEYRAGKTATLGFLVGQVMKLSQGQANPQKVNELLRAALGAI
ncbi:MAG: Asp-tRNA(Asn)/Glu-tRNA(Gln) amidotransferase subunit GatB [Candidatus Firestonebacteria bacterium]|nr:Asp-tRNA(Asn)/Glu-tRNA(Gln) amidotransferase subunit GatB [Candidatus Firestonebacteria bacterium]